MKLRFWTFSLVTVFFAITAFVRSSYAEGNECAAAVATPVACYNTAMEDSQILITYKFNAKNYGLASQQLLEQMVNQLCANATPTYSPTDCFVQAYNNPKMFESYKKRAHDLHHDSSVDLENMIVSLCSGSHLIQ